MHYDARMVSRPTKIEESKDRVTRLTVSLSKEDYEEIVRIAQSKKVSASWVVRDSIDQYLMKEDPLFRQNNQQ